MHEFYFHPLFIHFPIALFFLEILLLFLWVWKHKESYRDFAFFSFKIAFAFLLVSMVSGFIDADGWSHIRGAVRTHFFSAVAVLILSAGRAAAWRKIRRGEGPRPGVFLLTACAVYLVIVLTGYLGGLLVYKF